MFVFYVCVFFWGIIITAKQIALHYILSSCIYILFWFLWFLQYFVIGGNAGNTFYIDPLSGQIFTRRPLDFEVTPSHQLTVRATDGGGRSDDATVTINVQPINDNKPNCSATPRVVLVDETERPVTTASHLISIWNYDHQTMIIKLWLSSLLLN